MAGGQSSRSMMWSLSSASDQHPNTVGHMITVFTTEQNAKQRQKATLTVQPTPTCKTAAPTTVMECDGGGQQ